MTKVNNDTALFYTRPEVLTHQAIRFETAHSWNPGVGVDGKKNGNDGIHFPPNNPNPTPGGAGYPGNGNGGGNSGGNGNGNGR